MSALGAVSLGVGALIFALLAALAARDAYAWGEPAVGLPYPGCGLLLAGPFLALGAFPRLGWAGLALAPGAWFLLHGLRIAAAALGRRRAACLRQARDPDRERRLLGLEKLIRFHDPARDREARLALEAALESPDDAIFETAARELTRAGQGNLVLETCVRLLRAGKGPRSLFSVVQALGEPAAGPFGELLRDAPLDSRLRAVLALDALRSATAALRRAAADEAPVVRAAAVERLGRRGEIEPLLDALRDPDDVVRAAAALGLENVADASCADALLAATSDATLPVRRSALRTLGRLREKRAAAPALAALRRGDANVEAAYVLGETESAEAVEPLRAILISDPRHAARASAAEALRKLGWTPSTPDERAAFAVAGPDDVPLSPDEATMAALDVALRDPFAAERALRRLEGLLSARAGEVDPARLKALASAPDVPGPPPDRPGDPVELSVERIRELAKRAISRPG